MGTLQCQSNSCIQLWWPIAVLLNFYAAMAIGRLTNVVSNLNVRWSRAAAMSTAVGLLAYCVLAQMPLFAEKYFAFQNDHRKILSHFIRNQIGPRETIAEDNRVFLRGALTVEHDEVTPLVPNRVIGSRFVPDTGTISELLQQGVRYIAVFGSDRRRFLDRNTFIKQEDRGAYPQRKAFYDALEQDHEPVLELKDGATKYLNPDLTLFRLNAPTEIHARPPEAGSKVP